MTKTTPSTLLLTWLELTLTSLVTCELIGATRGKHLFLDLHLCVSFHLSFFLSHTLQDSVGSKTPTQQLISCFHTTSASFLSSPSIFLLLLLLPPPLLLFCGFALSFSRSFLLSLIGIALFEMEKLFTLTAQAFGWRSYPEPLVMLLETWQQ